jgi:hypothetical protein
MRQARVQSAPRCCGLHAAWDALLGRPPILVRSWQLRAHPARQWRNAPVCGVLHPGTSELQPLARIGRIAWFEVGALLRGRRWRDHLVDEARRSSWQNAPDPEYVVWLRDEERVARLYPESDSDEDLI